MNILFKDGTKCKIPSEITYVIFTCRIICQIFDSFFDKKLNKKGVSENY